MNPLHAFVLAPLWLAPTQGIVEPPASGVAVSNFDDARDIKSRDAEVRLAAVLRIAATNNDDTGKLLAKALKDDDWEIVTIAATALGEIGREKSLKNLAYFQNL